MIKAHVIPNCLTPLLIGTDFMRRFPKTDLQWKPKKIDFGHITVPMKEYLYLPPTTRGAVVLSETIQVPPRTLQLVQARVQLIF